MKLNDIVVGETYLLVATTNQVREPLVGMPFTVQGKKEVYRKRRGGFTRKVWRVFNADGVEVPADELEPYGLKCAVCRADTIETQVCTQCCCPVCAEHTVPTDHGPMCLICAEQPF